MPSQSSQCKGFDPILYEMERLASSFTWSQAIIIEDEDIMFGGKSLSQWHEEDRSRINHEYDDEMRRGRQRTRRTYSNSSAESTDSKTESQKRPQQSESACTSGCSSPQQMKPTPQEH